jgi:hypothetical protein
MPGLQSTGFNVKLFPDSNGSDVLTQQGTARCHAAALATEPAAAAAEHPHNNPPKLP